MSRKARLVILIIVVEIMAAGAWWYLARFGLENPGRVTADYQTRVGQTMGAVMGGLIGFGVLLFFIAAHNDRKANRPPR